jgi:P4 family phage/plasmid primase-like protien
MQQKQREYSKQSVTERPSTGGAEQPDLAGGLDRDPRGGGPVIYSRGAHKRDNQPEQCEARDFAEFVDRIVADRAEQKGLQFFCAASEAGPHDRPHIYSGVAHWRLARLARGRRYLPVDIDGMAEPVAFAELKVFCSRFHGLAYTTASHSAEAPRCRMVFELDRATDRAEGIQLGQAFRMLVEAELGAGRYTFDKSVFQAEQACYMPPVESEITRFEGAPIQVDALLAQFPQVAESIRERAGRGVAAGEHEAWLRDLLVGDNVHDSLRNLTARWVAQGWPDDAIYAQAELLLDRVAEVRGAARVAALLRDGELDRMIEGARAKGFAPRSYDEINADCLGLTHASPAAEVEVLIKEASRALTPVECDRIFRVIKEKTGTKMGAIRDVAKQDKAREAEDDPRDHLELAQEIRRFVGASDLLATEACLWKYDREQSYWQPLGARGEKFLVQEQLASIPSIAGSVSKALVEGVTDVLITDCFRREHVWNTGPADAGVVRNGELVLEGGEWRLVEHCREHYRTSCIPHDYDPEARAPRFEAFLAQVFEGDEDAEAKAQLILEMMGYSLFAHTRYEKFVMLLGSGANGKSVLLAVLEALVGPQNKAAVQPAKFDNANHRAYLLGKLVNLVTEISEGQLIADGPLKNLVTGEPITAEMKFKHPFDMYSYATLWFGANHLPHTRDFSDAMSRRVLIVAFNRKFTAMEGADPYLKEKLIAEIPGILNLALAAYANVVARGGISEPPSCALEREKWLLEANQVAQFVAARCDRGEYDQDVITLYATFSNWARNRGHQAVVAYPKFVQRLTRLGIDVYSGEESEDMARGLCLKGWSPPSEEEVQKRKVISKYRSSLGTSPRPSRGVVQPGEGV